MRREGHHQAVAGGDDGVQVALVVGDQRVVLEDRRVSASGGLGLRDAAVPQDVVAQVEAADADPLAGGEPRLRVPVLVDVVVDDVELALGGVERCRIASPT